MWQVRQRELAEQRAASAADRAELAEQRLQQRTELDMERLKFADDRRAIWEQLSQVRARPELLTAQQTGRNVCHIMAGCLHIQAERALCPAAVPAI